MLDQPSERRLLKLANVAQRSFAESVLLLDKNRLLFKKGQ
jgi:hypothetical protein